MEGRVEYSATEYSFFIPFRLDGANETTALNRAGWHIGSAQKRQLTSAVTAIVRIELGPLTISGPYHYHFYWHEPNRRRDPDNIAAGMKIIFDALQAAGVIVNDGWGQVASIRHSFSVDADNVGVLVEFARG